MVYHTNNDKMAVDCVRKLELLGPNKEKDNMKCFFPISTEDNVTNGVRRTEVSVGMLAKITSRL